MNPNPDGTQIGRPPVISNKFIYVLLLGDDKIYVGSTDNLDRRMDQHRAGEISAAWVKKYGFIQLIHSEPMVSEFDEERVTKEYMKLRGIDNVRGAKYSEVNLSDELTREIATSIFATDNTRCQRCGNRGHWASGCTEERDVMGYACPVTRFTKIIKDHCLRCGKDDHRSDHCPNHGKSSITCSFCRKSGHARNHCPTMAGEPKSASPMDSDSSTPIKATRKCARCRREGHNRTSCKELTMADGSKIYTCFTCSKEGHLASDCPSKKK